MSSPAPGSPSSTSTAATPTPVTPPPASPAPDAGLYLRAWLSQALPPPANFGWLPMLTISEGRAIDGNVAVPAIYPGPLLILPFERGITAAGQSALEEEARRLGLLGDMTDFTGGQVAPGSQLGHIELLIGGVRRQLTGDPSIPVQCDAANRCLADPATPGAFAALWQELGNLDGLIPDELGPTTTYEPESVAVLAVLPQPPDPDGLRPQVVAWPLETDFADFGEPFGAEPDVRCATVAGDELEILLPALNAANQLTVFIDSQDAARSLVARAAVPGEPSPCGEAGV